MKAAAAPDGDIPGAIREGRNALFGLTSGDLTPPLVAFAATVPKPGALNNRCWCWNAFVSIPHMETPPLGAASGFAATQRLGQY